MKDKDMYDMCIGALFGFVVGILLTFIIYGNDTYEAYRAFRDGQARVVSYESVDGKPCRAVLVGGRHEVEQCEGDE